MFSFLGSGQNLYSKLPEMPIHSDRATRFIKWAGDKISSPENRLILGASALISQPFIDLHNRNVDEETRKISALRTIAKIIAGTLTGVIIRTGCIKLVKNFTKINEGFPKNLLVPCEDEVKRLGGNLDHYSKAYGSFIAIIVMLFTNFLIDAPLTKFLTNKFIDKKNAKEGKKC